MMRNTRITDREEFEARQMPLFDFVTALAIRAARDVAEHIKNTVKPWWKAFNDRMRPKAKTKKQDQMIIEFCGIQSCA